MCEDCRKSVKLTRGGHADRMRPHAIDLRTTCGDMRCATRGQVNIGDRFIGGTIVGLLWRRWDSV